jgi:hypothetical protein
MALLARFRRASEPGPEEPPAQLEAPPAQPEEAPAQPENPPTQAVARRRRLPSPGLLRRERRGYAQLREQRIRDLGGLVLEMYRQDRFRQDLVYEHAAEIVAIEERLFQIDQLLTAAGSRRGRTGALEHCPHCGAPRVPGAKFCASCGQALVERA